MNKDLFHLLDETEKILTRMDADWAVGGALAMAAHGYVRETQDIDVFISPDFREQLLQKLDDKKIHVITVAEDLHYAIPSKGSVEERVDLMFPYADPDISAIAVPDYATVDGKKRPVWPLDLIVVSKLMGDREKDAHDLVALRQRGMVDAKAVHTILGHMGEDHAIARLQILMRGDRERSRPPAPLPERPSRGPSRRR
jgi:hypothetical protein